MNSTLWLLRDPASGHLPAVITQYGQLYGLDCKEWKRNEPGDHVYGHDAQAIVVGLSYRSLRSLGNERALQLRNLVRRGATVYVRGGFLSKQSCSMSPIVDVNFSHTQGREGSLYRIESNSQVPAVLHEETGCADSPLAYAVGLPANAVPLASTQLETDEWCPFLFAIKCGAGVVICDLLPDSPSVALEVPIVERIASSSKRHAELGALVVARLATGLSPERRPPLNLIVDDRPANFDLLNTQNLCRWLQHVGAQFPDAHVDFAWTPDQLYPARSYIKTMKKFNTGVVWHGFKHHVDHRESVNLADDLRGGIQMVSQIERRFGVEFQKIMVFPFESFGVEALPILQRENFLATFAKPVASDDLWSRLPSFMDRSLPLHEQFAGVFPVLRRHSCDSLTQDLMLGRAALNLPTIVVIHPDEIGLRRWPYPPLPQGKRTHCDGVLSFAAAKKLESCSLEEIARDSRNHPQPKVFEPWKPCHENVRQTS